MTGNVQLHDRFTSGELMLLFVWLRMFTASCDQYTEPDGMAVKPLMESLTQIIFDEITVKNSETK